MVRHIRNSFSLLASLLTLTLVLAPFTALAQSTPTASTTVFSEALLSPNTTIPKPAALSSCFDYYQFGSVPAVVNPSLATVAQSASISFSGTLTNQNPYPISDVTVYAKVFHDRTTIDDNGPDVVDEFPIASHVNLDPNQSVPLTTTWKVPSDADVGNYQLATYVVSSERFELSGLIFTDDVVGNSADFKVVGTESGTTRFVKNSAKMIGQDFGFAAFPPIIPATTTSFPVTIDVSNDSAQPYKGSIAWSLYYWDNQLPSHLLNQTTEDIKVHPNATTTASYMVTDTAHSTYFLQGILTTQSGSKSIVDIRFTRANVNEPRINFVTLDGNTAVACIHSAGTGPATNSQINLSVTQSTWYAPLLQLFGINVASASYSGSIPGDIYALTTPLKQVKGSYVVHATLFQNGKQVDSINESYSCKDLGVPCTDDTWMIIVGVIVLVLIIVILVVSRKRRTQVTSLPS